MADLGRLAFIIGAAAVLAGCGGSQSPLGAPGAVTQSSFPNPVPQWETQHLARTACPQVVGKPTCLALQVIGRNGITPPCSSSSSCGFTPAELQKAYNLTSKLGGGSGTKVAVIEAGDLSTASSDLATYRSHYGLGAASFFKYNENGQQSNYPPSCQDYGWCLEIDLDIEMISASCPNCTIYLMEAKDVSSISDFEQAEKEAVTLGATIVSNSWTCYGSWDCGDSNFGSYFNTSGIAYLASSGDAGYDNIGGPSVLDTVLAVGGTQLSKNRSGYSETLWNNSGSGCATPDIVGSPGIPKPSWQHDPDCTYRTEVDVSAQSGCSPGVAMYISLYGGWIDDVCGTSVASPFLAGVIGLAGNAANLNGGEYAWTLTKKQHKKYFNHPTGSAGSCGNYMCGGGRYKKYYSAPGGWGSPNGVRGF